ncbi:hypothetical protein PM082_000131 [Marasmius tenuissimus]|nr:hypothetical protein PM082_000605 [Marasmius tenuissimus]KAJ8077931.1 hypothetical protein PM082_000131 [Marasmius tenuissimus]
MIVINGRLANRGSETFTVGVYSNFVQPLDRLKKRLFEEFDTSKQGLYEYLSRHKPSTSPILPTHDVQMAESEVSEEVNKEMTMA